ncbi:MAG: hypothetical protein QY303_11250 [Vicingaceae bacterium]|nr:MAG: hypothetical protein QY303_11250 [Vicingaceae bacterium]
MKKIILVFSFTLLFVPIYSQTNIVNHGDFEYGNNVSCDPMENTTGSCPNKCDNCITGFPCNLQKCIENYFDNYEGWFAPKRKLPFPFCNAVGSPDIWCEYFINSYPAARSGIRYGHIWSDNDNAEYLVNELTEPVKNDNYFVEFYLKTLTFNSVNVYSAGIRFYENHPKQCGSDGTLGNNNEWGEPHLKIKDGTLLTGNEWKHAYGYFSTSGKNYKYLSFGRFNEFPFGYRILVDDIRVIKLGPNFCPPYWKFQNTEFNTNMLFQAADYITIGENHDNTTVV